jgi:hypothetical protein
MSKVMTYHGRSNSRLYRIIKGKSSPGSKKKYFFTPGTTANPAREKIQQLISYIKFLLINLSNYEKTDLPKGTKARDLCLCAFEVKKI